MADHPSGCDQRVSPGPGAAPSTGALIRWITLLPGVFLVSSCFIFLAGGLVASVLQRPAPIVMELLIPVSAGCAGVLFAYWWAPDHKWSAAVASGMLLGVWFWLMSLGWAGAWPRRLLSSAVGLAIVAAPWLLRKVIADRQARTRRTRGEEPESASGPPPLASATAVPAHESHTRPAPAAGWDALRWVALLPASGFAYYASLVVAVAPMSFENTQGQRVWLSIVFSHVIAGWVALLCGAWVAPARKRSVAYVGYLIFLALSLPLSGRMLVARGVDTTITMLGLWCIVAVGVAPAVWAVSRVWRAPARTPQQ